MKKIIIGLLFGLILGGAGGFVLGIYALPIIIDWQNVKSEQVQIATAEESDPKGQFDRNSPGSDALHWGTGTVRISRENLIFEEDVELSPGPDYRIYLVKTFVETKEQFLKVKPQAIEVAKLSTFKGPLSFSLPAELDADVYDNVVVWCEAFSMYIASARLE